MGIQFRHENKLYRTIPHEYFYSPVFLHRSDHKGINLFRTFLYNLLLSPVYLCTIIRIAHRIRVSDAQVVIVFYDMLGQLGSFFSFSGKPVFSVSHHFFFAHSSFKWPVGRIAERKMLILHSWLASLGARKKLAISFTPENNIPGKKLFVVPPVLRKEILDSMPASGDHIHIYCLHTGFLEPVVNMAKNMPQKEFRVFLHDIKNKTELPSNVYVSSISGDQFRDSMITSGMIICTAGFETLAEAIYLNKPLVVIPSKGHFEQYCNAADALRTGAAIIAKSFEIDELPVNKVNPAHTQLVNWIIEAEEIILKCLTE
jgi:uncharacterized protein (TIGR00661 family)